MKLYQQLLSLQSSFEIIYFQTITFKSNEKLNNIRVYQNKFMSFTELYSKDYFMHTKDYLRFHCIIIIYQYTIQ